MSLRELQPGLFEIASSSGDQHLALYLIVGERLLLVDSGLVAAPAETIIPALQQAALGPLDLLLNSHCDADHHGGNAALAAAFPRLVILAHAADQPRIASLQRHLADRYLDAVAADDTPYSAEIIAWLTAEIGADTPVHLALQGGELLNLGPDNTWEVVHVPGHTAGHLALWRPQYRTLIIQDAVLGSAVPDAAGRPVSPPPYFDLAAYRASIQRLRDYGAESLFSAHFPARHGADAVAAFFDESLAFTDQLQALILQLVTQSAEPLSLAQICRLVDVQLGPYDQALQWVPPIRAHLNACTADKQLRVMNATAHTPRYWCPID